MVGVGAISTPIWLSSPTKSSNCKWAFNSRLCFPKRIPNPALILSKSHSLSLLTTFPTQNEEHIRSHNLFIPKAAASSSDGSAEYTEEPATSVKFYTSLIVPGCSSPLCLLGTGYREKVFAIIGVKVYAAGLYVNPSIFDSLNAWKGQSAEEIEGNSSIFGSIFQASAEKSLQIVLVRNVDGNTFWDALDEAVSPRIKARTQEDEFALSTFRGIFQGRSLKKGTLIFLTWLDPTKMLVCVSFDGMPSLVDATIESTNVTLALFEVFFGSGPVSPCLKTSVSNGLATALN